MHASNQHESLQSRACCKLPATADKHHALLIHAHAVPPRETEPNHSNDTPHNTVVSDVVDVLQ